jgi:UDP-hydrolysing UDP-N-acetyl-D-glucosamine 2-epimerase
MITVRRIGVVTVARSDYGIYRPILRALEDREDVELILFVGGMHLAERFGHTVDDVERDGFAIAERVDFLLPEDTPAAVAASIGRGIVAFADAFERSRPDLIVVLGDRFEMYAAAVAALPFARPLAHVHGGESTEGAIDEALRHSLTKLSHLHFASTEAHARRIVQLGEEPWRVVVSGAPALDALREFEPLSDEELGRHGVRLNGDTLLVTYHPVTVAPERTGDELEALLDAIERSALDAVLTYPNADASHGKIVERIDRFAASSRRYTLVRNLGSDAYFTLMGRAAAMVGNSSSGIIEAASFQLPVVDVGMRQRGRIQPPNVIHAEPTAPAILDAIERATSRDFREGLAGLVNPYGDGHAAGRIAERLATIPLDERLLVKRFHDLDG